jgi:lipopolysaccharide export system protein LptC
MTASASRREGPRAAVLEVTAIRDASVYRAARRHSALVRVLKIVLPVLILVGLGGFGITLYLSQKAADLGLSFGSIDLKSNSLVMEKPEVSGFHGLEQSYEVNAERAVQSLATPNVVTLEGIGARIGIATDDTATVRAGTGVYDTRAETLVLTDGIHLSTTTGYTAHLEAADVDLKNGSLQALNPVELTAPDGTIRGNELQVFDGGKRVVLRNGVSMTLLPGGGAGAEAEPEGGSSQ